MAWMDFCKAYICKTKTWSHVFFRLVRRFLVPSGLVNILSRISTEDNATRVFVEKAEL